MSFTDQKPFEVTKELFEADWSSPLRCAWCGHRFHIGDTARWVLTNTNRTETIGIKGNPYICEKCDGPREVILARLRQVGEEFRSDRFWWFRHHTYGGYSK